MVTRHGSVAFIRDNTHFFKDYKVMPPGASVGSPAACGSLLLRSVAGRTRWSLERCVKKVGDLVLKIGHHGVTVFSAVHGAKCACVSPDL